MASAAPVTAPAIRDRSDFAFSAQGRYGVCVSTDYVGRTLESWTLTSEVAQYQAMTHVTSILPLVHCRWTMVGSCSSIRHGRASPTIGSSRCYGPRTADAISTNSARSPRGGGPFSCLARSPTCWAAWSRPMVLSNRRSGGSLPRWTRPSW